MSNKIKEGDYVIYKSSPRSFMTAQVLKIESHKDGFVRMSVNDEITISDVKLYMGNDRTRVMDYKRSNDWYPSENMLNGIKRITKKDFNALLKSYKSYKDALTKADAAFKMVYDSVN